jgi:aminoglycoside phosphotransferase (APT) family kinase protein
VPAETEGAKGGNLTVSPVDIVDTPVDAEALELAPLIIRNPLEDYLEAHGYGSGAISVTRIDAGYSNATYLVERGGYRLVLRRPPRPPLPPSAHDMLREARVQAALERSARVPHVRLVCEDESVLGAPFYVMDYVDGAFVRDSVPPALDTPQERHRIGLEFVDALAEIHAVDWVACGLESFGKPTGYLERQVRRFSGLWELNATRELAQVAELAAWLDTNRPESGDATIVHGDYRLGNVMLRHWAPARVIAVLDWELATIGDPLADVGYLLATYSDANSLDTPMELSPATRRQGFPSRAELIERYEQRTGRSVRALSWYEALALWKSAVFCEAIFGRWLRGEKPSDDPFAPTLETGVPRLLEAAVACAERG